MKKGPALNRPALSLYEERDFLTAWRMLAPSPPQIIAIPNIIITTALVSII